MYTRAVSLSRVWLFAAPWTIARQAPLSVGFSRQEYWSGFPCPPPGDLPDPGMEPASLMSPALAGGFFTTGAAWGACCASKEPHRSRCELLGGAMGLNGGPWWPEAVPLTAALGRKTKAAGSCHWQFFSISFWRLLNEKTHMLQCGINFKTMVNNFFCSDSVQFEPVMYRVHRFYFKGGLSTVLTPAPLVKDSKATI